MSPSTIDTSRCPICGASNACVMVDPATAGRQCWCTDLTISEEALSRIPEEARNIACICRRCAERTHTGSNDS